MPLLGPTDFTEVALDSRGPDDATRIMRQGGELVVSVDGGAPVPLGIGGTWPQEAELWVSPDGDDDNDGRSAAAPKRTLWGVGLALVAAGGGTIHGFDGGQDTWLEVGHPTLDGIGWQWRGDGLEVEGWLPCVPLRFLGCGSSEGAGPFQPPGAVRFEGGGGRGSPQLVVVNSAVPMRFERLQPRYPHHIGLQIGVDYNRREDGSVYSAAVAGAARTGTTTVYTVTLPAGFSVASISRTSNVTTVVLTNPGTPLPPFRTGVPFRLTSSDGNFPSGDYEVTSISNYLAAPNGNWTITYADPGANASAGAIGTVQTHGVSVGEGEFIDLTSSDPHFLGTQYQPVSVTADTITVTDVFNTSGNQTGTNIGTLAHQERFAAGTSMVQVIECGFAVDDTDPLAGPSVNIGHTAAIPPLLKDCWIQGYVGNGTGPRDEKRMAAVLVAAGSSGNLGPAYTGLTMRGCRGTNGSVYGYGSVGRIDIDDLLMEANYPALQLPSVKLAGGGYMSIIGRNIHNADNAAGIPTVSTTAMPIAAHYLQDCEFVETDNGCFGGDLTFLASLWATGNSANDNPWTKKQFLTPWADGRITGKHPAADRAFGTYTRRFRELALPPSGWTLGAGQVLTTGITGPDSSTRAVKITGANTVYTYIRTGVDGETWGAGDRLVIKGWVRGKTTFDWVPEQFFRILTGDIAFTQTDPTTGFTFVPVPYNAQGWQAFHLELNVVSTAAAPSYIVAYYQVAGGDVELMDVSIEHVPNATIHRNDAAEYASVGRAVPNYLPVGMAGTGEGVELIGHGGLGTANAYVEGVGSGQLTIVGSFAPKRYEPILREDGTVKGWVELINATVNP